MDLQARGATAASVAAAAGTMALELYRGRASLQVEEKALQDYVSAADRDVERYIVSRLKESFPADEILAEESGGLPGDALWVIDPIDGTSNFLRGLPLFCVSIAFVWRGVTQLGVIADPVAGEVYTARRGQGAFCGDTRLSVRAPASLRGAMVAVGYSHALTPAKYAGTIGALLEAGAEFRRFGTAALSLAYVASGRIDGFAEKQLSAWDALAGLLLVTEAGGTANAAWSSASVLSRGDVLATAPGIFDAMARATGIG